MKVIRTAAFVLMVIWMGCIFAMSQKPSDGSTKDIEYMGELIGRLVVPDFEELDEERQHEFARNIDHGVRKTAHASEYALLAILAFFACYDGRAGRRRAFLTAFIISAVYAGSDELHQLFVPGRSGQITDVLIDSAGALMGLLFPAAFFSLKDMVKKGSDE